MTLRPPVLTSFPSHRHKRSLFSATPASGAINTPAAGLTAMTASGVSKQAHSFHPASSSSSRKMVKRALMKPVHWDSFKNPVFGSATEHCTNQAMRKQATTAPAERSSSTSTSTGFAFMCASINTRITEVSTKAARPAAGRPHARWPKNFLFPIRGAIEDQPPLGQRTEEVGKTCETP